MTPPALRLEAVSKAYETPTEVVTVLSGVDLAIEAGEKVSLMGPSGSGKSTLLALVVGLLVPDSGTIEVDGTVLGDLDDDGRSDLRRRHLGIAQQSGNLIPFLSAVENVELAFGFGRRNRREDRSRANDLLGRMGLLHRADHLPRRLSGGEAQRVALAVAIANEPALLLADEMVSALDTDTAAQIVDDLFATEMAVLFVTHDEDLADRASRRLSLHDHEVRSR